MLRRFYHEGEWEIQSQEACVYLSFDDGPHPTITPWVVEQLNKYDFKATFFCVGENAFKYPETLQMLRHNGHHIGNHTYNHLVGWNNTTDYYISNLEKCQQYTKSMLFRPPHGRIKKKQLKRIKAMGYRIIFWSVLSFDFDKDMSPEECLELCKKYTFPGSIIVFHDSEKAWPLLEKVLPLYLKYLRSSGYTSKVI